MRWAVARPWRYARKSSGGGRTAARAPVGAVPAAACQQALLAGVTEVAALPDRVRGGAGGAAAELVAVAALAARAPATRAVRWEREPATNGCSERALDTPGRSKGGRGARAGGDALGEVAHRAGAAGRLLPAHAHTQH